ncbi:plasmid mobilization relaxosome protein MobC [Streptomyces sp. NBC_00498]
MHDPQHEPLAAQQQTIAIPVSRAARYPVGPSKGRSNGGSSAPGVAEAVGRQGAPDLGEAGAARPVPSRAADEAALHRVARRRRREPVQRKDRVDVRYSSAEKAAVLAKARALNIAGAHYVGAVVMAHLHGDLALPGQRTQLDDYIDELAALREQVAAIGRNANQIAKKINSGGTPHPGDTALLAQAERTLATAGSTVTDIAAAANQAVTTGKKPEKAVPR